MVRAETPKGPPPPIMPLRDVRPGMKGQAWTVFSGTRPEPFDVRVISVLPNFLPKQDIILIRAEDPRVVHAGIVGGMSGSPVMIEGKLVGAIAYGWSFLKDPIGGVTPIESMLAELDRPLRGHDAGDVAPPVQGGTAGAVAAAMGGEGGGRLVPVSVPLSLSGFGARVASELGQDLASLGFVAAQGGGGRKRGAPDGRGRVEPGSSLAVELVRGDMSAIGTGTVTWVDGDRVLAFGHSLMGIGELYLPLVDAEVHTFLPSLAQSVKVTSPLHEVGVLVQDRQSCVVGDLGRRMAMVPVRVKVSGPGGSVRPFDAEIVRHRRLLPVFLAAVVGNAVSDAEPDVTDILASVRVRIDLGRHGVVDVRDDVFGADGIGSRAVAASRVLRALGELLLNPFDAVSVERVDVDVDVEYGRKVSEIVAVSLGTERVRAGAEIAVRATVRPLGGKETAITIPITVPASAAGKTLRVEVAGGQMVRPEMAPPENLAGLLDNLRKGFDARSVVVSVQSPEDGATLRGRLLGELPPSALDTLGPSQQTTRTVAYKVVARTVKPAGQLVTGRQVLQVAVESEALGR